MRRTFAALALFIALGMLVIVGQSVYAQRIREDEPLESRRRYEGDEALRQLFYAHISHTEKQIEEAKEVAKDIAKASLDVEHRLTKVEQSSETVMNLLTALCAGVALQIFNMIWRIFQTHGKPK